MVCACHVTQEANFENFLFYLDSTFNIGKSHKISSGKALYFRNYHTKTSRGGKHPLSPVSLELNHVSLQIYLKCGLATSLTYHMRNGVKTCRW